MPKPSSDTPTYPRVSVQARPENKTNPFTGRYTLGNGRRPTIPAKTWTEAFTAAVEAQKKVDRGRYRSPEGARMTVAELVSEHWAPTTDYKAKSKSTRRSHLGNSTATANGKGRKNERGAKFALLARFGHLRLSEVGPQDVLLWQREMVEAGYAHGTILAKRSLLRAIFNLAVLNGWMDLNHVDAVPVPKSRSVRTNSATKRGLLPEEFNRIREGILTETLGLLVDTKLEAGLRFQTVSGLRAMDVIAATPRTVTHLWVRQAVNWVGREDAAEDVLDEQGRKLPYVIEGEKSEDPFRVTIGTELYERLVAYIEKWQLTPEALIFDHGRIRAEHTVARERIKPPTSKPAGRYVNPRTGRSGEHGVYWTYNYGCHCVPCKNANTEYRFWLARRKGRPSAQPWLEEGFIESRSDAVDPIPYYYWNATLWGGAVADAALDWKPTGHKLRHAMVTWSLEGGASLRQVQRDANHANARTTQVYIDNLDLGLSSDRVDALKRFMNKDPELLLSPDTPTTPMEQVFGAFIKSLSPEEQVAMMMEWMGRRSGTSVTPLRLVQD